MDPLGIGVHGAGFGIRVWGFRVSRGSGFGLRAPPFAVSDVGFGISLVRFLRRFLFRV